MVSTSIRIHGPEPSPISEQRTVDTPDLRLAELSAPCQLECIGLLRDRLLSSLKEFGVTTDLANTQTCMALEECLANAFYHGTLGLDSALKEDGSDTFRKLAQERCMQAPYKDRRVRVTELATPLGVWITVKDEGAGFDIAGALQRVQNTTDLLASGRGLIMMKSFTDELIFNAQGNEVTLVIYHNRNQDVAELLTERAKSRNFDNRLHSQV